MSLRIDHIPGDPETAGFAHGAALRDLVEPAFLRAYLERLHHAIGFDPSELRRHSLAWLEQLPGHFGAEIDAMAAGARVGVGEMAEFLYADIATSARAAATTPGGPMCSAVIARMDRSRWVARNCDWLTPTLMRGTAAVVHDVPGRIPIMAVGIRGDIDVDTGLNAEGLWLHLHTLHATDPLPPDRPPISWLFWAREALETCATLDELERFIAAATRDRGVFVIAAESRTGHAAVFECARATHTRHDAGDAMPVCVTNHSLSRPDRPGPRERPDRTPDPNASGTISRRTALRALVDRAPPQRGPDDLIAALSAPGVEMRSPRWLRTIYSAVVEPETQTVWFASGTPDGSPAASTGRWTSVRPPWAAAHR